MGLENEDNYICESEFWGNQPQPETEFARICGLGRYMNLSFGEGQEELETGEG